MTAAPRRLATIVLLAVLFALQIWLYGFSIRAMLGFCGVLVVLVSGEVFAEQVRQPWRNYAMVAAASAFAGLLLFSLAFNPLVLLFWLACTAMALFWVWYWERTEPLPSED